MAPQQIARDGKVDINIDDDDDELRQQQQHMIDDDIIMECRFSYQRWKG